MICWFSAVTHVNGIVIEFDPGAPGTSTSFLNDFSILNGLDGTPLTAQFQSLDLVVTNHGFLVAAGLSPFTVELFFNESGAIGTWPAGSFSVTGYLMDDAGNPVTAPVPFGECGAMPAQIWPGWPFYLPDGTQYLPATQVYGTDFGGERIYGNPDGYYVAPVMFSGMHLDITYPNNPGTTLIGGRLLVANFDGLVFVSPDPVPDSTNYFVSIPQPVLSLTNLDGQDGGRHLTLQLSGTPEFPYILQSATNLADPVGWRSLATNSLDASGHWSVTITNVPGHADEMFFRAVSWPWPPPP
jgi:hypothetical protein